MFEKNRGDEGWQPFSVVKKPIVHVDPDLSKAREVKPILMRTNFDFANAPAENEAEAPAETDPKDYSATSSVSVSEGDSSLSGNSQTQDQTTVHPSSLPPETDNPASVERETKGEVDLGPLGNLISMMNLGPKTPGVEGQP